MEKTVLKFTEERGYSRLFRDYIYDRDKLTPLFGNMTSGEIADAVGRRSFPRETAVEILRLQNSGWKAPRAVMENIERLSDKKAVAVVAGQQAGLFGGPYLALLKALAAVKLTRNLERELKVPIIPIFGVATDDHDYKEISFVDSFDKSGALTRLEIDVDENRIYPPVGSLAYDDSVDKAVSRLREILPDNDFKSETIGSLSEIYGSGRNVADCFAEYMLSLVGGYGVVLFNPYDKNFKRSIAPLMQNIVARHDEIGSALSRREESLTQAGYHIQVQKASSAAYLFHHTPERTAIHLDDGRFRAGDIAFTGEELKAAIEKAALDFSPDALTRPLAQSFFFPTAAIIAGPSEIAYLAQMMPLFDMFGLVPPKVLSRPSMTVVETRFEKYMDEYAVAYDDLIGDVEVVVKRVLGENFPGKYEENLSSLGATVIDRLNEIGGETAGIDSGLEDTFGRTGEKIAYQLQELAGKVFSAYKRKHNIERDRIYRLRDNLYPHHGPAERSIAPAYLISRYGRGIIDFVYEKMNLDETGHRLLMLSEYHG